MFSLNHQSALVLKQTHTAVLLKRCASCHAPHPLARKSIATRVRVLDEKRQNKDLLPADRASAAAEIHDISNTCPDCGHLAARPQTREGRGKFLDPLIALGDGLLRIGASLHKLSEKL